MDESMEDDTELPGFTLPGETSQDPIADLENPVAQLAGVSYQVPDTIEWEQQNQGLVRSWMEKLKDKQREFNSMQDRVMLLADSSEDEF